MLAPLLLAALVLLASYLYNKLRYKRLRQYANFPQLPASVLFGHLKVFDEYIERGAADRDSGNPTTCRNSDVKCMYTN